MPFVLELITGAQNGAGTRLPVSRNPKVFG